MRSGQRVARIILLVTMFLAMLASTVRLGSAQDATPAGTPEPAKESPVVQATVWLVSQQQADGSFLGFSGTPDTGTTLDAILALAAAGSSGMVVDEPLQAAIDFVGSGTNAQDYAATGIGQAAKLSLALSAAGINPPVINGVAPLDLVIAGQNAETGLYGNGPFDQALSVLALVGAGQTVPESAFTYLAETRGVDGGWAFDGSVEAGTADGNTTALVLQALVAGGQGQGDLIAPAVAFLQTTVKDDGAAFNGAAESLADSNSTAYAVQAFIAVGGTESVELTEALAGYQNADGSLYYQGPDMTPNLLSTAQAIPAFAGLAFPFSIDAGVTVPEGTPQATPVATPVTLRPSLSQAA